LPTRSLVCNCRGCGILADPAKLAYQFDELTRAPFVGWFIRNGIWAF
jgi:hypothetical protein